LLNNKIIKKDNNHWFNQSIGLISQVIIEELKKIERLKMDYIPDFVKILKGIKIQKTGEVFVNSVNITSKIEMLKDLRQNKIGNCKKCSLHQKRTNIVFGVGNPQAKLVFVGEAPGEYEDISGEPFVGRSGKLLTKMIQAMGFKRSDVYICNVIKCRPPTNRDPQIKEIFACELFLKDQLAIIQPKVLVALGRCACQSLLKTTKSISEIRGVWGTYEKILLMPTFHPSYLLRNSSRKKEVWKDLQEVMKKLKLF